MLNSQPYDIDFEERGYIKEHIGEFLLFPMHWTDVNNQIALNLNWQQVPFDDTQANNVPANQKGVYCFALKPIFTNFFETNYLFYIGETKRNFRVRYKEYLRDAKGRGKPRTRVYKMLKLYKDYLHFYYASISSDQDIIDIEEKLLNTFVPEVNTEIPKAGIKPELKDIYL